MSWTPEKKALVIAEYKAAEPTAANTAEIVKELAEKHEESPNGVRMILMAADAYVKVDQSATAKSGTSSAAKPASDKAPRVSKEAQHKALEAQISRLGREVDADIVSKLTGKAAAYFVDILSKVN